MNPDMAQKIRLANDLLEAGLLNEAEYLKAVTEAKRLDFEDYAYFLYDLMTGKWATTSVDPQVVCECGAEKCKLPHSHWCPKYLEEV